MPQFLDPRNCLPLALLVLLHTSGCSNQNAVAPQGGAAATSSTAADKGDEPDSCDELLKSLFDIYRIDKFETTFDVAIGANRMNDWYRGCASRAGAPVSPGLPEGARDLFSGAQQALMNIRNKEM